MPTSPHFSAKILILLLSLAVTITATWVTVSLRETPTNPIGWPRTFLQRGIAGFRIGGRERVYWGGMLVYSTAVSAMHFGGLHFDVYGTVAQWDFLTHILSGFGVAMLLYLTFHLEEPDRSLRWIIPAVLAFGAGFEVYEFVFKDFWYGWTLQYYLIDTVVDFANNVIGSLLAVGGIRLLRS